MSGVHKKSRQGDTSIRRGTPLRHIRGGRLLHWSRLGVVSWCFFDEELRFLKGV